MEYILKISGFDVERDELRTERKTLYAPSLQEAMRAAGRWMDQHAFAEQASVYAPPGGAFDELACRRRRGAWEVLKK